MATSQLKVGTLLNKQHVYVSSEMRFRAAGRGIIAAKGGSRQQKYLCDQQQQGCKARVHWVKQATDEWKVSRLDGEHENCGRALRRQQGENRFASVKIFITIHQPKSFLSP